MLARGWCSKSGGFPGHEESAACLQTALERIWGPTPRGFSVVAQFLRRRRTPRPASPSGRQQWQHRVKRCLTRAVVQPPPPSYTTPVAGSTGVTGSRVTGAAGSATWATSPLTYSATVAPVVAFLLVPDRIEARAVRTGHRLSLDRPSPRHRPRARPAPPTV